VRRVGPESRYPGLPVTPTEAFLRARDTLLRNRDDLERARAEFRWPELDAWNWARDWFDVMARSNDRPALVIVHDDGSVTRRSFAELSERAHRVARYFHDRGAKPGDRLLLMLPNTAPLWETLLGAIHLGLVVIPATSQLTADDVDDRVVRGDVRHVVTNADGAAKVRPSERLHVQLVAGGAASGAWADFGDTESAPSVAPAPPTRASDPMLLYFTSGTTAKPKLVLHTHASYPVGHLSTMYWIGLRDGDVHQNISSPGWAKHAWSSVFAPWNAGATVLVHDYAHFRAEGRSRSSRSNA
jgi:acetyl-CoA synthetase